MRLTAPCSVAAVSILILVAGGCSRSEQAPTAQPAPGPGGFIPDTKPVPVARWTEATVPRGTTIKLSFIDTLSSENSRKGDMFRALVTEAVTVGGDVVVPSGSNIVGKVGEVSPTSLRLEFERIDTPTGASAPLKARLADPETGGAGRRVYRSTSSITVVLEEPLRIQVKQ